MDEEASKVAAVFFDAMIFRPDVLAVEEAQDTFLELAAAFPGNDLDQADPLADRLVDHPLQFGVNRLAAIEDVVQVQFDLCQARCRRITRRPCPRPGTTFPARRRSRPR
jgi:hypothetical protein